MGRAPTVLANPGSSRARRSWSRSSSTTASSTPCPTIPTWADVVFTASLLTPAVFLLVLLALPLANARGLLDRPRDGAARLRAGRGGPRRARELRQARGGDAPRVLVPRILRGALVGRDRRLRDPRRRRDLRLAGADAPHRRGTARGVRRAVVRVPGAGRRRVPARSPRPALLRDLPRRLGPLEPARPRHVGVPRRLLRRDDGPRDLRRPVRDRRPPGAAAPLRRLPRSERRSHLAPASATSAARTGNPAASRPSDSLLLARFSRKAPVERTPDPARATRPSRRAACAGAWLTGRARASR